MKKLKVIPLNISTSQSGEKIYQVKDFYEFLEKENIEYGFISKLTNEKILLKDYDDNTFNKRHWNEYYLQSPKQVLETKCGLCWDLAELERYKFNIEFDIESKIIFIQQKNKNYTTHTFLVYKLDDKYFWFEYSFEKFRSIHLNKPFNSIEEVCNFVHRKMRTIESDDGFEAFILKDIPKFGISAGQYMNWVDTQKQII